MVSTLFTYWAPYVEQAIVFYKGLFPRVPVTVGGVYATLMSCGRKNEEKDCAMCQSPCHPKLIGADEVFVGDWPEVDACAPDYSLLGQKSIDFMVCQVSKGCPHRCPWCGNHRLSKWQWTDHISEDIWSNKLTFYDAAFLDNPAVEEVLDQISRLRPNGRVVHAEAQSGINKYALLERPHLAAKLKAARFIAPRIAWDRGKTELKAVREAIHLLNLAGYALKDLKVFLLYNYDLTFQEVEAKRRLLFWYGVQGQHCRYRPLDSIHDGYSPYKRHQERHEYYIHPAWTDAEIREFGRRCRSHNIAIRHGVTVEEHKAWIEAGGKPRGTGRSHRRYPVKDGKELQMTYLNGEGSVCVPVQ